MKNVKNNWLYMKQDFDLLSIRNAKSIVKEVINRELDQYNLKANIKPITNVEYEIDSKLKKDNIYNKIIDFIKPSYYNSYYSEDNNKIVIFIDNSLDYENKEDQIFNLLIDCFHEARHVEQTLFSSDSYYGFLKFIDEVNAFNSSDYNALGHDSYSYEIGANLYSIRKTREFMKSNYPFEYELKEDEINILEKIYYLEFLLYDAPYRIDRFLKVIKECIKSEKLVWEDDFKNNKSIIIPDILKIFLNKDGKIKDIGKIVNNDKFNNLDKRIIYSFFSSQTFLENIDLDNLTEKELSILKKSLSYTRGLENLQINWLDDLYKKEKELFKIKISNSLNALSKIGWANNYILNEIFRNIRFRIYTKDNERVSKELTLRKISKMQNNC